MLNEIGAQAKDAAFALGKATTEEKNNALLAMAAALRASSAALIAANACDMAAGKENNMTKALLDRLLLTPARIEDMAEGLESLASLPDPIGQVDKTWKGAQDIIISQVRVPLGVVGIIYEARLNVTADAAGICLKTGNAVILRGSKDALNSNKALVKVLSDAVAGTGLPARSIQLIEDVSRETAAEMMRLNKYIDVLIPRGSAGLIRSVVEQASVPVIETGVGNCHIYVDAKADLAMAVSLVVNAKTQRPGVCNAAESLLVHQDIAADFLPIVARVLRDKGVELRGCPQTCKYVPDCRQATEEDYYTEFLDLILSVKVVKDLDEAIAHINKYGSMHSEAIVTMDMAAGRRFQKEVDAAAVYVNASTRFTDGFQFGFGAEIGISTQKLHARGPMGLSQMTTIKYIISGNGQVRK